MESVKSNPLEGAKELPIKMNDSKNGWYAEDGWVKMARNIDTSQGKIEIHFIYNKKTQEFAYFKFKN